MTSCADPAIGMRIAACCGAGPSSPVRSIVAPVTRSPTGRAARHVEMQRAALEARLARNALQLGHVRHVAHGHAAIIDQADHAIDLELGEVVARRAQRRTRRRRRSSPLLRLASAHCRPPTREFERPVVAQAIDRDAAAPRRGRRTPALPASSPGAGDQHLGGAEVDRRSARSSPCGSPRRPCARAFTDFTWCDAGSTPGRSRDRCRR